MKKSGFNILYALTALFIAFLLGQMISRFIQSVIVIPGNIIGMGLMFLMLQFKVVDIEKIEKTAEFFLSHLSLFFIPFGVSIMKYYGLIQAQLLEIMLIIVGSSIAAMTVSIAVVNKLSQE